MTTVTVRWHDGYLETFEASEVRVGGAHLWMRLASGPDRWLPTGSIRWFSLSPESHQPGGKVAEGRTCPKGHVAPPHTSTCYECAGIVEVPK